jgi:N-acylneuraminate cytidylyltransferase
MWSEMKSVAIIPARGGSSRIPGKNVKLFFGKPIIGYAIETALKSNLFSEVIVSTNDEKIGKIAETFGAKFYWLRTEELSQDLIPTVSVMQDAIKKLPYSDFNFACCIYPATPLLQPKHLRLGLNKIYSEKWDYVFLAKSLEQNFLRGFLKFPDGKLKLLFPENEFLRTQDLTETCIDAGQYYWGRRETWLSAKPIFSSNSSVIIIGSNDSVDIDTIEDWKRAEKLYAERQEIANEK